VTCERFDAERRRSVLASFVLRAADSTTASQELDDYLESPTEGTVGSEWNPRTMRAVLDIPAQGITSTQKLSAEDAAYYNKVTVPGDGALLVEFKEFEPAD
jgi:hypothetical protein